MNKSYEVSSKILTNIIRIIITNIADEYIMKLKKDKKNPPQLIENYLDQAVFLTEKPIKLDTINKYIETMNNNEQIEFNNLLKEYKEYEILCEKLNFVFNIIQDQDLQYKILESYYTNFIDFKNSYKPIKTIISYMEKNINNYDSIMTKFNKNKNITNSLNSSYLY